jgi:hypothetical protein
MYGELENEVIAIMFLSQIIMHCNWRGKYGFLVINYLYGILLKRQSIRGRIQCRGQNNNVHVYSFSGCDSSISAVGADVVYFERYLAQPKSKIIWYLRWGVEDVKC